MIDSLRHTFLDQVRIVPGSLHRAIVSFDPDRARSVFENLIKNALESTSSHDPAVEVEVTRDRRHMLHIYVRDRGDGIPEENMEKIFDPFFTTKIHGSGIGLAICRQFIRAKNGNLKLYARDGGGTIAEVILPAEHP